MITKSVIAAVVGAAAILVTAVPAGAATTIRTIVTGLDSPRGIAFGPHGELYVAEAGRSGAITVVSAGGRWRIPAGPPSPASPRGAGAIGPSDVAVGSDGRLYYTVGRGGDGAATLYRAGRGPTAIADLGAHEKDADPTGLLITDRGHLVVDAGANALVRVAPRGRPSTVAAFPAQEGIRAVAQGPDGAYYAGGRARIWRVVPGEAPTVYASGFTGVIDLAWAPDGRLYVLRGGHDGALLKVDRKGAHRVVAEGGLVVPGGLAIRDGYAYISDCGVCQGTGSVVKVRIGS
ncbi:hypothetical protein ACTI_71760 [Actinoplanes sp. OR16]|uniref:ScyD/ScyE family protein n=1 Tax=Actinoplanes sp. OR16 TaxID=946334 RepID=UPI000F6DE1E9|nr:ScyD/ScyE family protein [Actinoplanes sp. OR16]BBH70491.1 hypothetical protein ACTI_71760 [Actinoplanes sp. OR16]